MPGIGKKASIPVTVFTILTVIVFAFALISFFVMTVKSIGKISDASIFISKFAIKQKNLDFEKEGAKELTLEEVERTGFLGLGEERLRFSIRALP